MALEERNDRFYEIPPAVDDVLNQVLAVVVVAPSVEEPANTEEITNLFECGPAARALHDGKAVRHLVGESIAGSVRSAGLADEAD